MGLFLAFGMDVSCTWLSWAWLGHLVSLSPCSLLVACDKKHSHICKCPWEEWWYSTWLKTLISRYSQCEISPPSEWMKTQRITSPVRCIFSKVLLHPPLFLQDCAHPWEGVTWRQRSLGSWPLGKSLFPLLGRKNLRFGPESSSKQIAFISQALKGPLFCCCSSFSIVFTYFLHVCPPHSHTLMPTLVCYEGIRVGAMTIIYF